MPLLFSYGTLQGEEVQRATFGRLLRGDPDALIGFAPGSSGPHANAERTDDPADSIPGKAFEVSDDELAAADDYERPADYRRIEVWLGSGKRAWVYVHRAGAGE